MGNPCVDTPFSLQKTKTRKDFGKGEDVYKTKMEKVEKLSLKDKEIRQIADDIGDNFSKGQIEREITKLVWKIEIEEVCLFCGGEGSYVEEDREVKCSCKNYKNNTNYDD